MGTIIMAVLMAFSVNTQNMDLVEQVSQEYNLPIRYIEELDWDSIESRTPNELIVEVVESTSVGDYYGTDTYGYTLAYNLDVPSGEHVTSYIVYNPYTTQYDDIIAVIDNGMRR